MAPTYLITGAGGGIGSVSRRVVEQLLGHGEAVRAMVHRDDSRADALRALGADVFVGDLTNPVDVGASPPALGEVDDALQASPRTAPEGTDVRLRRPPAIAPAPASLPAPLRSPRRW